MSPDRETQPSHPRLLSTELVNGVTHGLGLGLSIAGLAVLVVPASRHGEPVHIVACHTMCHLFVVAGGTCHFFAVMLHVLPIGS